jgi:predicted nuclease of predicted toxin-antitoxin system
MRFLIDAHLPPGLADVFVQIGHEAVHVFSINHLTSDDEAIWQWAAENNAVIVP